MAVYTYRKIPFATPPPLGSRRFMPPLPPRPTREDIDGTMPGPTCSQFAMGNTHGITHVGSEDCLSLLVYTSDSNATAHLPVHVWIFGGAFEIGSGATFGWDDAKDFSAATGAVVVAPNYRVGTFGFLEREQLAPGNSTGNVGLLDLRLALQVSDAGSFYLVHTMSMFLFAYTAFPRHSGCRKTSPASTATPPASQSSARAPAR